MLIHLKRPRTTVISPPNMDSRDYSVTELAAPGPSTTALLRSVWPDRDFPDDRLAPWAATVLELTDRSGATIATLQLGAPPPYSGRGPRAVRFIGWLAVAPDMRSAGLARYLIDYVGLSWPLRVGAEPRAERYWRSLGFVDAARARPTRLPASLVDHLGAVPGAALREFALGLLAEPEGPLPTYRGTPTVPVSLALGLSEYETLRTRAHRHGLTLEHYLTAHLLKSQIQAD